MPPRRKKERPRATALGPVGDTQSVNVFTGEALPDYVPVKERFIIPPTSVWTFSRNRDLIRLRELVGDEGQERADSFMGGKWLPTERKGNRYGDDRAAASVFNPILALALVEAYSRPGQLIFDPFAGGGTRAIIAAIQDRMYHGLDVRRAEVDRVTARLAALNLTERATVMAAASQVAVLDSRAYDALITCPPYHDLEVYSEDPLDLSTAPTYAKFLEGITAVVRNYTPALKSGVFVAWVVGSFRSQAGELRDFPSDVTRIHQDLGYTYYDQVCYTHANPQALYRLGMFDKTRKVVRVHEDVRVFLAP